VTAEPGAAAARPGPARGRALLYYAAVAGIAALLLAKVVPFGPFPLAVPFHYAGDGVLLTAIAQGVAEDGPLHLSRIGAPFGSDIVDWPIGVSLPFAFTTLVVKATGQAGLALNLLWLAATALGAASAAWALRRLGHAADLALVLGIAYAFLPCGFYRNVGQADLVYPLVPLLALASLRACGSGAPRPEAGERWLTRAACVGQGLSSPCYSLFATWLVLCGAALGWLSTRQWARLRSAAIVLALLVAGAAIPVVPTAVYRAEHGRNERLQPRLAAEADALGLSLRQVLLPIDDHPLPAWRGVASRMQAAFRDDAENATARLGTLGSLGFVLLIGVVFARGAGRAAGRAQAGAGDDALGPAAALTLAAVLLAQVGGLGSLWSAVVSPDVRGYNRIVVFLAFYALHAVGVLLERPLDALRRLRLGGLLCAVALSALLALVVADQVPRAYLATQRWSTAARFAEDAAFVSAVEARLPAGAMVFQLPHATIPLDLASRPPMEPYDPARAFIHSRRLRRSWGSLIGRAGDWQAQLATLAPAAIARRAALAGFDGVWVDRWGYPDGGPLPWRTLEKGLAEAAGESPLASGNGRHAFLPLARLRERLAGELGPAALAAAREEALATEVLLPLWREGCSDEHGDVGEPSRVCGASGWAVLTNDAPAERRLALEARFRSLRPGTLRLLGDGFTDELSLAGDTRPWRRELTLGARRRLRLGFDFLGPCEATAPRARCLEIVGLRAVALPAGAR
jgi:phosphoglycerol transferase